MSDYWKNKRALITGASKGIGRAIAIELSKLGTKVIAVGRSKEDLESLKQEYPTVDIVELDVALNWDVTKNVLKSVLPIDLLVNNAGEGFIKPLIEVTEEDFDRIFNLNVKALYNVTQIVVEDLLKRKVPGAIVNLSSQAGLVALMEQTVYCSSKGAVDSFSRTCALELGRHNIRVNSVNPTAVMTEMGKKWFGDPARAEPMLRSIPLGRFAEVEEVVDAVIFLLSNKSSMITGITLPLDGGFTNS